jgi:ABC-type multidrug transport system ATPase subunit
METAEHFDRVAILSKGKLLEVATPQELQAKHARPRLEIFFSRKEILPSTLEADLHKLPIVDSVRLAGRVMNVRLRNEGAPTVSIIEELKRKNLHFDEIREHAPTLEEAYFGLTGEGLKPLGQSGGGAKKKSRGQRLRGSS